jgi:hypothetical protein
MSFRAGLALFPFRGIVLSVAVLSMVVLCREARAQSQLAGTGGGALHMMNTDLAVLEAQDVRKDLPCSVTPIKPVIGFDLRFHAGYEVNVPLKELSGTENKLTILFRVIPENHKDEPVYFSQHVHVPSIEDDAHGDATLGGSFDLGEGNYHVDWLMRDRSERVCSFYWDSEALIPAKDKQIALEIPAGTVRRSQDEQFIEDPPIERAPATGAPLNIKVLVNFAPQNFDSPALRPMDTVALVSILRRISREPQFRKFSLVAFNIQEQRVVYRQSSSERIDFPALGHALESMKLGTVDTKRLAQKHGDTDFLTDLIKKEMSAEDHPDALVFAGPKIMLDAALPQETLTPLATDVDYPVFYMNYILNPNAVPWRDSISRAVKVFRGTEYTISRPRDLWYSVTEMVSRIVKSKHSHLTAPAGAND